MDTTGVFHPVEVQDVIEKAGPKILSVDLFDTLVYRRCRDPHAVFVLQYGSIRCLLPRTSSQQWLKLRTGIERELSRTATPYEIHLSQIYDAISKKLDLSPETRSRLIEAELDAEKQVIRPYGEIVSILAKSQASGTVICITTDTYLPVEFIRDLLDRFLPFAYSLLCSSESLHPKRTGLAFQQLREMYCDASILHIGDNPVSDVTAARGHGIVTCLVDWGRERFMRRNRRVIDHLSSLGVYAFDTPAELFLKDGRLAARRELAWRWATVLTDFLLALKAATARFAIQEVWLLSRDCETLFRALEGSRGLLNGLSVRYVYTSRSAAYPIFAIHHLEAFQRWMERAPDDADLENGRRLESSYRSISSPASEKIMVVDSGWKGRLQMAFQLALPEKNIFGFYFSLDQKAEAQSVAASDVFLSWDASMMNQPAIEALAGFQSQTCTGYNLGRQGYEPTFSENIHDVSPPDYCEALFEYLCGFLATADLRPSRLKARRTIVRQLLAFPDQITADAFRGWSIAAAVDGTTEGTLFEGGKADRTTRILGLMKSGNLWPALALWSVIRRPGTVRVLQFMIFLRKRLKALVGSK